MITFTLPVWAAVVLMVLGVLSIIADIVNIVLKRKLEKLQFVIKDDLTPLDIFKVTLHGKHVEADDDE